MSDFFDRMLQMHVDTGNTIVGGILCTYDVISRDFEPRLPNFVGVIDLKENTFFISEEVPVKFRPAVIAHEAICHRGKTDSHGRARTGHCLEALSVEIKLVPEADQPEYIRMRQKFFDDLVEFTKDRDDEHFKKEIAASRDFLHCLNV